MAATITGISRVAPIVQASVTAAAVGPGDAAVANLGTRSGFKGSCISLGQETAPTAGYLYTAWQNLSPSTYDISGADQYMICHFRNEIPDYHQFPTSGADAAEAVAFILFSGGGSSNWAVWYMAYSPELVNGQWHPIVLGVTDPAATGGTWDNTDVTGYGVGSRVRNTDIYVMNSMFQQLIYVDGIPVFGDDSSAATEFQDYIDILSDHVNTTYSHKAIRQAGTTYEIGHSFNLTARNFNDTPEAVGIAIMDNDLGYSGIPNGTFKLNYTPPASGTQVLDNYAFASSGNKPNISINGSASSSAVTLNSCLLATANDVSVTGSGATLNSVTIPSPATLTVATGDVDVTATGVGAAIQWTSDLVAGSTITTNSDIDITFAGTNLDDINLVLTGALTISVDPTGASQTYYLGGIVTSSTLKLWNKDTSNATTIEIPAGITNQKIDLWFNYDGESGGPFTVGETLTFGNGATATLRTLVDNGTTGTMYCTYIAGTTPPDNNSITGGTSSATAAVNEATGAKKSTLTITQTPVTYTFNSDTASTLIRYFEDGSQTVVDSVTGTTLDYDFPDADPVDVEFVKQGYVPVNRQNVTPSDGGTLDIIMDVDEAYNASHALTITSQFDYNRGTKVVTFNSDQEALDVRSALADVIRTNSAYYNTALLMVAIPGLTRVDLTNGMTITSMATWKGAGMERFDAADSTNPVEKWVAIKSVGNITGASAYYRQTSSGNATSVSLTSNLVNEAFQYWSDPDHDGSTADGYNYSGYFVIKTFLAGTRQSRADVVASSGLAALKSNLYTISLANLSHDYAGTDPGISADLTLIAGGTEGGVAFAYEWVDGGTNTGADIADQLHYNRITTPNGVIPGGTGLRWWEMPDMVIHNATSVETEKGYREGATPTVVGFYASRGGADHPDFTRFEGDNGTYYTPAVTSDITFTGMSNDGVCNLQIANQTAESASAWQAATVYAQKAKVLRSTGIGSELTAGLYYVATTGGTSGGSEPTFPIVVGNTVVDGTVTWTCYAVLFYDADPASTSFSDTYIDGEEFNTGDTYRYRYADLNGSTSFKVDSGTGIVSSTGFSVAVSPTADVVYATNAVDGLSAAITNIYTANYTSDYFVLDANLDFTNPKSFAFYCGELTTSAGMHNIWGAVTAIDVGNYRNDVAIANILFDETGGYVKQEDSDNSRWYRSDGARPFLDPTSGGSGIHMNWKNPVYTANASDAIYTQPSPEPTSVPAANAPLADKIDFIFAAHRNKTTQTSTTKTIRNDSDTADIGSAAVSNNGTTVTRQEYL